MARLYKVLGQSSPAATTDTNMYTVPAATETVVSTISVCNRASTNSTYRVAIRPNGDTIANQHYLVFDAVVPGNDMIALTIGVTLSAGDVITVRSSTTNLSFQAFGSEIVE
jgi:glucose-6-phosphate dehydrogenase assembly protein OpcA